MLSSSASASSLLVLTVVVLVTRETVAYNFYENDILIPEEARLDFGKVISQLRESGRVDRTAPRIQQDRRLEGPDYLDLDDYFPRVENDDDNDEVDDDSFNNMASLFPKLDPVQRRFAVNPSFKSFYDPSYREEEGITTKDSEQTGTGEVGSDDEREAQVGDAITAAFKGGKNQFLKKASNSPIMDTGFSPHQFVEQQRLNDIYFTTIVAVSSALAVFAVVGAGFCYHRIRRNSKASEDVEYPAYGITGPGGKETSPTQLVASDRKLAQNAQMYHYQHQKQQMIAFDSAPNGVEKRGENSDCESDDGEEGDYTVYECPGLAPAGEMEVRNPLFQDDPTPKAGTKE